MRSDEGRVLKVLAASYGHEQNCLYFRYIARKTRLPVKRVRVLCRRLARKGLAKYQNGLFDEDGAVAGSGYCCTEAGWNYLTAKPPTFIGAA